jgi:hypothetical protein
MSSNPRSWRGVLDTTLCDKVCQWLTAGRWFSPDTPVSSINNVRFVSLHVHFFQKNTKNHNVRKL